MGKTKSQKSIDKSPEKAGPSSGKAKQPSIQRMLVTRPMSSLQKLKKCPNDAWTDSMGMEAFGIPSQDLKMQVCGGNFIYPIHDVHCLTINQPKVN